MHSYIHGSKKRLAAAVGAALLAGAFSIVPRAEANPVLDAKDAAVSISGTTNMNITSEATNNLIKWVDFSIGSGEKVTFDAKNYLNYVTGSARSDILGTLTGGGNIYLVNPNGILIGDGATVNVGSLYLSTKKLTADQLANYSAATGALFQNDNAAVGDVINLGNLNANVISVEGNNITFKNVADVKNAAGTAVNTNVTLTASGGEIHIGSAEGGASGYNTNGTTYNYKLISTKEALQNMKDGLAGNYMLAGDIDMSGVNFTPVGYSVFNHETGRYDEDTYAFKGRFDGLGYAVKNLSVNFNYTFDPEIGGTSQSGIGLFGWNKGTVENVKLSGGSIESTQGSIGIIGINDGTVRNVFNDGLTVKGGEDTVGGIVGYNNTGTIKNVWNKGTVSGSYYVGGIAGNNHASIENAWNNGRVSGSGDSVGGIVGNNQDGIVQNVYNTGAVQSGSYSVGGIVGVNQGNNTNTIVQYAYNTGNVTSSNSNKVGGIVGSNYAIISNAYSQEGTAAAVSGEGTVDTNTVAMKSETDMKQKATFADFDFSENGAWRIYEGQTMPLLTAFLTRKDNITSTTEYNGSSNVGATYVPTTYSGVQTQSGYNFIQDVSIVTPKNLTVSFGSKTYDGTTTAATNAATLTGAIVGNDVVSLQADSPTAAYADKNVGTGKAVNFTGLSLTGANAANYNLAAGTGDITPANITISVNDYTKTYDGTTDAGGATLKTVAGRIFAGDSISGGMKTFDTAEVGTGKTVTVSGVIISDGNNGGNYSVTYQANTNSEIKASPEQAKDPASVIENVIGNKAAAKEYTDVMVSLNSGTNTVLPTANVLPTESVVPTNSVLPTGNNQPTGSAQPTEKAQENNSVSGEQNGAQEQNGLLPAQPTAGGQPAAGRQETQLGVTYTDINMPKSMSVEALAAALNGETTATLPNNAGGEVQPTGTQGTPQEGDEEEA